MNYLNHFCAQSTGYLNYRPTYPKALFAYLANLANKHSTVLDCGAGNGQASNDLAKYFPFIVGMDRSQEQLIIAKRRKNLAYICADADNLPFANDQFGLITVAQALHWFNLPAFYKEIVRIATSQAYFAAWCYSLGSINAVVNKPIENLYFEILGDKYWPHERHYIDAKYETIPFPFVRLPTPKFKITKKINFYSLLGYLSSWSAVKEYQRAQGKNPLGLILNDLCNAWGDLDKHLTIHWPIHLLVGKIR
jgi:SAM-dependent methyltransferase